MDARADMLTTAPVAPIYIGPRNCEHVIGHGWRWCRDTAKRLGVPILRVGGKPMIPAADFGAALSREAPPPADTQETARQVLARRLEGLVPPDHAS